jgi:aminoglycoside phosphotransferase (APT) family kinase protein
MLRQLSKAEARRAIPSLVQAFDAIHLIKVDEGTAVHLPAARSAGQTWRDALRKNIDRLEAAYRETSYSDEMSNFMTASDLMKLYWDLTEFCPNSTDLLHGDLNSSNIFVDDQGVVSAIIDWNLCRCGDFLWDVARTATVVEREWGKLVIEEYVGRKSKIANFDERFKCYMIRSVLGSLPFFIKRGSIDGCLSRRRKLFNVLRRS